MKLLFNLPGDWPHPYLLFRLLEVVECPWNAGPDSTLFNPDTGEQVNVAWAGAQPDLAEQFALGTDPTRDPLPDDIVQALEAHKGVFMVYRDVEGDPLEALRTTLRGANAIVDGGATAVQCVNSGLVHGADAFQAQMKAVDAATDRDSLKQALYATVVRYQLGRQPMTFGMAALGLPDLVIPDATQADRAIGMLERAAMRDDLATQAIPDPRPLPDFARNPHGMVVLD